MKKKANTSVKLRLCAVMLLTLCTLAGCRNTDKQAQSEDNNTTVPQQQNQTEAVAVTTNTEEVQTETATVVLTAAPTPEPNIESVQTEENTASSKMPSETENSGNTEQVKRTNQPEGSNGKIVNKALGFTIQFSEKLSKKIKDTSNLKRQDDDFGGELHYIEFYTKLEGKKQPLFIIYRINRKMTEAELEDVNLEMGYLGCSDTVTYTIEYTTEPKSGLSRESEQEFENLMSEAVGEILETFQIIK